MSESTYQEPVEDTTADTQDNEANEATETLDTDKVQADSNEG